MKILLLLALMTFNLQAATVLFIGDSHSVGPFGWALDQHLRDAQHQVATYASCGSIPKWWMSGQKTPCGYFSRDLNGKKTQATVHATPLLKDLLADIKPEVVILEFGGNYVKTPSDAFIIKDIQNIITQIKATGSACFWITNPDTRLHRNENPRVLKLIQQAVGSECPIFNSSLVTRYPETGGDGIHYWNTLGTPIARSWALKAFEAFKLHWN